MMQSDFSGFNSAEQQFPFKPIIDFQKLIQYVWIVLKLNFKCNIYYTGFLQLLHKHLIHILK